MIKVYTDGACSGNPGIGGWGSIILEAEKATKLYGNKKLTTNNEMELTAVMQSLKHIDENNLQDVTIYSDSAYVINAIIKKWIYVWNAKGWVTSTGDKVKNLELWKEVYNLLLKNPTIKFVKVKGHSGDTYNELVDKLARQQVEKLKSKGK